MKIWFYSREVVLLILGVMKLVCGDICLDVDSAVQGDKYMQHQVFRKFWSQSLYTCASECLMSSACLSFGFEKKTRTCLLNINSSDSADVVDRTGFLFSDIKHWPQALSGPCSQRVCTNNSRCEVTRLGPGRCAPEFQGCGHPPDVRGASVKYDGQYQEALATYSCDPDFRTCHNNISSTCLSSGLWESLAGLCGQFRWHDPSKDGYSVPCGPSNGFRLKVIAAPTNDTRWTIVIMKQADKRFHSEFRFNFDRQSEKVLVIVGKDRRSGLRVHTNLTMVVGQNYEVDVSLQDGVYGLAVDGASIYNFTEAVPGAEADNFKFVQDVSVSFMELVLNNS
ncbi:uncharacterized protein [Haliotis asinina]|uniref:uncharacterized protein n=1 Tax=Haliotis asinina TaxID=109174 RepID=UPI003532200C